MKKTMKKLIVIILVAVFVISAGLVAFLGATNRLTGLMFNPNYSLNTTVKYSSTSMNLSGETNLTIDWNKLFESEKNSYDPQLAKLSFLLCMDAHNNGLVTTTDVNNTNEKDNASFPKSLNFTDTVTFNIGENAEENANDKTTMVVSNFSYNSVMYINISFNATADNAEWISNMDIGAESENYPGNTTDWTTKENHKGFDVAATRSLKVLETYFKDLSTDSADKVIVGINGYSRGAAIANIVAAKFYTDEFPINNDNASCFAYTFATPNTTTAENRADAKYDYIQNVVSMDDLVTKLAPEGMGFGRYGKDVLFDLDDEENATAKAAYNEISGKVYSSGNISPLVSALDALSANREEFYTIDTSNTNITYTRLLTSDSMAKQERANYRTILGTVVPVDLGKYVTFSEITGNIGSYKFSYTIAPSYIAAMLPTLLNSLDSLNILTLLPVISVMSFGTYQNLLMSAINIIYVTPDVFKDMHYPSAYMAYIDSLD